MESVLKYKDILLEGAAVTITVAACSFAIALVIALSFLFLRSRCRPVLSKLIDFYPQIFRSLPELLIIFFLFYGSGYFLKKIFGEELNPSPFISGVFALTVVYSAFIFEVFRGAQFSLSPGESTAAAALGLNPLQVFIYVQWPSIWRIALPSLGNLWLSLIKETALVSIIGLSDLLRAATIAAEATQKPFSTYFIVALIYLAITYMSLQIQSRLAKRFQPARVKPNV